MKIIKIGSLVKTEEGDGVVVDIEFPEDKRIKRYGVKMDKKVNYRNNTMYFFTKEVEPK